MITQAELLANAADADGDNLTATGLTISTGTGTLVDNGDGSWNYTPAANDDSSVSLSYSINDGTESVEASGEFDITPVNDAPDLITPNGVVVVENSDTTGGLVVATLAASDVDVGETFTFLVVGGPDAASFSLVDDMLVLDDGVLDFESQNSYSVVIRVTDSGGLTHDETIVINVTDVDEPAVVEQATGFLNEGDVLVLNNSLLSTTDPEESASNLVYTIDSIPADGNLMVGGDLVGVGGIFTQADVDAGLVTYTHSGSETISDSFVFSVSNSQGLVESGLTFDLVITPVNDAPVAVDDSYTILEDSSIVSGDLLSNDFDSENDALVTSVVTGTSNGTLTLNSDGTFDYVPDLDFNGTETFEYEVSDGNGGVASATATINVTPVNDIPEPQNDFYQVLPGQPFVSLVSVIANDADSEGNALTAITLVPPSFGTLSLQPDGQFIYTPQPGFSGVDSFSYLSTDGTAATRAFVELEVISNVVPGVINGSPSAPSTPSVPGTAEPASDIMETTEDSESDSEEDVEENIVSVVPQVISVPVVNLQDTEGFQADGDLEALVDVITDQHRAKTVLRAILTNIAVDDLAQESTLSEELDQFRISTRMSSTFDAQFLFSELDDLAESKSVVGDFKFTVGAITAFGTLGYVFWALRGGALVAIALSQLPAWQMIDPLPILDGYKAEKVGTDDAELDGYFN